MTHTTLSLLFVAWTLLLDLVLLRTRLLTRKSYWTAYAIVLFFQLLTNEWLTGRGVVVYGEDAIVGVRIGSAPVEDFVYGFALVTQSMVWWVWWGRRGVQRDVATWRDVRRRAAAGRPAGGASEAPRHAG